MFSRCRPILRSCPRALFQTPCPPSSRVPFTPSRTFAHVRGGLSGPNGPRYRRRTIQELWQEPKFRKLVGYGTAGGTCFYVYNLETVPLTGRRRFNVVTPNMETELAKQMFEEIVQSFQGRILSPTSSLTRRVRRVLDRLIPVSGLEGLEWEVYVIADDSQKNAFVIPGGKVFVFTGILPICRDEDGLAAVLSHEISHVVARHSAERMSKSLLLFGALLVAIIGTGTDPGIFGRMLIDLALLRPGSRKQEAEADYIGLMLMAQACFQPENAVAVWERMEKAEEVSIPEFLSTHPANTTRIQNIKEWLPEAKQKQEMSDCSGETLDYARAFKKAFNYPTW